MMDLDRARRRAHVLAVGAAAVACFAVCGVTASSAFAAAATTLPASSLGLIAPFTDNNGNPVSFATVAGFGLPVKVTGVCPAWVTGDPLGLVFTSGNAVLYRPISPPPPQGLPFNGGNIEGQALLVDLGTNSVVDSGHAHLWFGTNTSPVGNLHSYNGATILFDGSTLELHANPGGNTSASGNQSGWGGVSLSC